MALTRETNATGRQETFIADSSTGAVSREVFVASADEWLEVTLSLDTSAYASGDVLADTQVVTDAMLVNGGRGLLYSVSLVDEDDQGVAFTLLFFRTNVSLGTENAGPSISDANAREYLGRVEVATTDWKDLGGVRVASPTVAPFMVRSGASSKDLYVAALNGSGSPTFSASGVKLKIGILRSGS